MRAALFVVFLAYVVLLVIRPQEFVPALQHIPILQYTLLGAFELWLAASGKRRVTVSLESFRARGASS